MSGELVVFASTDGNVYALKAASGKEVWRFTTGRPIVASPRIAEGVVYIGSSEGIFRALDLATGKPLWQFDRLAGFVETKPLVYDGKVIFGAWDQHLYALDAKTGKLAWKWKGDKAGTLLSPAACWPIAAQWQDIHRRPRPHDDRHRRQDRRADLADRRLTSCASPSACRRIKPASTSGR